MASPLPDKLNPDIVDLIEDVARMLTHEELKCLEINTRAGRLTFQDRMISRYGCFCLLCSPESAKEKARSIIDLYRPVILSEDPKISRLFIEKFRWCLFCS